MSWQYQRCSDELFRLHQNDRVSLMRNFIARRPAAKLGMPRSRAVESAAHASGPASMVVTGTGRQRFEMEPLSAGAITYAQKIVDDWRATGLEVNLVEYFTPERGIDGYALTARGAERVLCCVCRCWRVAARFRHGPSVWTIEVLVSGGRMEEGNASQELVQRAGLAVAATHEEVWRQVQDWQQGKLLLQTDMSTMPASALLVPRSPSLVRPWKVAGLAVITAAVGTMAYAGYVGLEQLPTPTWPPTRWMAGANAELRPAGPARPRPEGEIRTGHQVIADRSEPDTVDLVVAPRESPSDPGGSAHMDLVGADAVAPTGSKLRSTAEPALGRPADGESAAAAKATTEPAASPIVPGVEAAPAPGVLPIGAAGVALPGERQPITASLPPATSPFALQVASVRESAVATTWQRLLVQFPTELAGLELRPARAPKASRRSIYYPVIAGAFATRAEAQAACDRLQAAGGECLVVENSGGSR